MIRRYRSNFEWKRVKGNSATKRKQCLRCHNEVDYFLAWDGAEFGLLGILTFKHSKIYSYKCPICPEFETIDNEVAKAIIKSNKNA